MYKIGIDLGGTNIAAGIIDKNLSLVAKKAIPTLGSRPACDIVSDMAYLIREMISQEGMELNQIDSIGIGVPGVVNPKTGLVVATSNINIAGVNLRDMMHEHIDLPIFLENDANAATLGEYVAGAAFGYTHCVMITLGTGIGGGIIVDGKIYTGKFFGAGELGHMTIEAGGEICGCGRAGHWEAYSSATALIRDAKKLGLEPEPKAIFEATETNAAANKLIEKYMYYLCLGLSNIIHIFQPDVIVIGGGISMQGKRLIDMIEHTIPPMIYGELHTKFAIAKLGNDAGIIGAAML